MNNDLALQMTVIPSELPQFDMALNSEQLTAENTLQTAVMLSLFTDRLANSDDVIPDKTTDHRGWWADAIAEQPQDKIGSRLWLLDREKQTLNVLRRAEEYAYESLTWLLDDGIAKAINVTATNPKNGWLKLDITIDKPDQDPARYTYIWEALNGV